MGEANFYYFTCLNSCSWVSRDFKSIQFISFVRFRIKPQLQNVQGSSSRTKKVHGQETGAPNQRWPSVVRDFARLRSIHESRHRRSHREEEEWRPATDRHGRDSWELNHHAGGARSDLTKTFYRFVSLHRTFHSITRFACLFFFIQLPHWSKTSMGTDGAEYVCS